MPTPTKEHARAERVRQHAAAVEQARRVAGAMGLLVRGREARARGGDTPLEVEFAQTDVDGRSLPAGVWVALRRDDVTAAIEAMTVASQTEFLIEEHEVMGEGYRLQAVRETLPLPESAVLTAQLSRALDVPLDVLTVIADWGPDDPRATSEIEDLLTSRYGRPHRSKPATPEVVAPAQATAGQLSMTVADATEVLRLDEDQRRALEVLVNNATVTLAP
jgi:hypothetical protein